MDRELRQELNKLLNSVPLRKDVKAKIRKKFKKMSITHAILLFNDLRTRVQELNFALKTINGYSPYPK